MLHFWQNSQLFSVFCAYLCNTKQGTKTIRIIHSFKFIGMKDLYKIYGLSWATACKQYRKTFDTIEELRAFYKTLIARKSVRAIFDIRLRIITEDYKIHDTTIEF